MSESVKCTVAEIHASKQQDNSCCFHETGLKPVFFILLQDEDTSYLDEATRAPDAPLPEPGADSVVSDKDGVLVDEFGLPKIPAQ